MRRPRRVPSFGTTLTLPSAPVIAPSPPEDAAPATMAPAQFPELTRPRGMQPNVRLGFPVSNHARRPCRASRGVFFNFSQIVPFVFAPRGSRMRENCSLYLDSKDHQRQKGDARPDLVW